MMPRRMKYLLKIPLLAISMACNRSAQEIKMIVPQSPVLLLSKPPTQLKPTPCTAYSLLSTQHPPHPPTIITATICILLPLMSSHHDNSGFGMWWGGVCVVLGIQS